MIQRGQLGARALGGGRVRAESQRFEIKRASWVKPLLVLFGATQARSYVTVNREELEARFGFYRIRIPIDRVAAVERAHWPLYGGLGWRTNLRNTLALVGSYDGVVRVRLSEPIRTRLFLIPIRLTDLYVSVENPDGLIAAITRYRRRSSPRRRR